LAQEPETCVVDSMPTSAITVGAIDVVEDLETIADTICSKVNPRCVAK
jgi:chemotaxis response regulator CheB